MLAESASSATPPRKIQPHASDSESDDYDPRLLAISPFRSQRAAPSGPARNSPHSRKRLAMSGMGSGGTRLPEGARLGQLAPTFLQETDAIVKHRLAEYTLRALATRMLKEASVAVILWWRDTAQVARTLAHKELSIRHKSIFAQLRKYMHVWVDRTLWSRVTSHLHLREETRVVRALTARVLFIWRSNLCR